MEDITNYLRLPNDDKKLFLKKGKIYLTKSSNLSKLYLLTFLLLELPSQSLMARQEIQKQLKIKGYVIKYMI